MDLNDNVVAAFGDQIEVTNPARVDFGKRMQVATAGDIAVTALDNRIRVTVDHGDYKVVKRCGRPATSSAPAKPVKKAAPATYVPPAIELKAVKIEPKLSVRMDANGYVADVSVVESKKPLVTDADVAALEKALEPVAPMTQEQIDVAVENLRPLYGVGEEPDPLPSLASITQDEFDAMTRQDEPRDDRFEAFSYAAMARKLNQAGDKLKGATIVLGARQCGKTVATETILDEAAKIIDGDRESTHGDPGRNLRTIARYWSAHLSARYRVAIRLDVDDIAIMMTGLKLARLANNTKHRDSQIDACGYMRLLERVQTEGKA